eukprot:scaffold17007_cov64-Cyclotella_meneghiniana.AAC.1
MENERPITAPPDSAVRIHPHRRDYEVRTKKFANHHQLLTAISSLARFFAEVNDRQSTSTNNVTNELR